MQIAPVWARESERKKESAGDKVLVNGSSGAVGIFVFHIAKMFGAEVTAVDTTAKLEQIRAMGADHVIDFTAEDFTRNCQAYNLIIEVGGFHSVYDHQRVLAPGGKCSYVGGSAPLILQVVTVGTILGKMTGKKIGILGLQTNKDLAFFGGVMTAGKVTPIIDKVFSLAETAQAFRHYEFGAFIGKIVISVR